MFRVNCVAAWMALAIGWISAVEASAEIRYSTLALSGQSAPDLPAGVNYEDFSSPHLNDTGQAAYRAFLSGSEVMTGNSVAIYAGDVAAPRLLARSGDAAPGTASGVNFLTMNTPAPGGVDQVTYRAFLTGAGVTTANETAIYAGDISSPVLIARGGAAAPGAPVGVVYSVLNQPIANDSGQIAYLASLAGSGVSAVNDRAIYAGPFSAAQLVAREGAAAPGVPAGVSYGSLGRPTLNDGGEVAYFSYLSGSGVSFSNDEAIFAGLRSAPQLVARKGDSAPGAPAGVNLSFLSFLPALNDAGQVAYLARLTGVGVNASNSAAIYAGALAAPQLIARTGEGAPGTGAGVVYSQLHEPVLSDAGRLAYTATLIGDGVTNANNSAIYAGHMTAPELIARGGDAAPGMAPGVNFLNVGAPSVNDQGQVVFFAGLTGSGVSAANDRGLFVFDPSLGDLLIAREGDLFDVGGGDLRTIADGGISFAVAASDVPNGLSNNGTLAFKLDFTDGASGLFVATHVPEPAGLVLVALGLTLSGAMPTGRRISLSSAF